MTAPTPSSPDPDHSRRSSHSRHGHGGRHGDGEPGSHRRGDSAGGDHPAPPYGPAGPGEPQHGHGPGRSAHGQDGAGAYGRSDAYGGYAAGYPADGSGQYPGQAPVAEEFADEERTDVRREVRTGALTALVVLVLGVGLGLLWLWLAPRVPLVKVDGGVFLKDPEGEEAIGADGTFVLLAVGFGVVTGLIAFLRSRGGGVGLVVGLAVGALLGSVLAWQLGVLLGPSSDLAASAKAAGANKTFDGPLKLQAKGALLVWPFIALTTHLLLMAAFGHRDPEPEPGAPLQPEGGSASQNW